MSVAITIEGTDRTSSIRTKNLAWNENLTNKVDTLSFEVIGAGSLPFSMSLLDEVLLTIDGDDVFGGRIVSWKDEVQSRELMTRQVMCKDYTIDLDRFRHTGEYDEKPIYVILRDLIHTADKRMETRIAQMESDESWTTGTADTTDYREGSQSIKVTSTGSYATDDLTLAVVLDLSSRDNVEWDYFVDNASVCAGVRLRLGDASMSNYYQYEITSGFSTGWNHARIAKGSFTSSGSPSWSAIARVEIAADATGTDTVNVSFDDLFASDTEAFTMDNASIPMTLTVDHAQFTYKEVTEALKRLAGLVNYDWYVDADKDLHFFSAETNTAPFELTDTGENYVYPSLKLEQDISKIRNVIYVFGGEEAQSSTTTEDLSEQADGTTDTFKVANKYANYALTVNSVSKTVGVDGTDSLSDYDALYNKDEKTIQFASVPAAGNTVEFSGNKLVPLARKIPDGVSITRYGEHEMVVEDEEIETSDGALQRALAEIVAYGDETVDGSFETHTAGLRVGMKIHVSSTVRGIDEWYVIQKITGKMRTQSDMAYSVQLVSTKTYGMVEILQALLADREKDIDDYDTDHLLSAAFDIVEVSESVTASTGYEYSDLATAGDTDLDYWMSAPFSWVAGNYEPASNADTTRTPCADGGATLAS